MSHKVKFSSMMCQVDLNFGMYTLCVPEISVIKTRLHRTFVVVTAAETPDAFSKAFLTYVSDAVTPTFSLKKTLHIIDVTTQTMASNETDCDGLSSKSIKV